ncbi:unnamed protein product [Rhodiola kirilowii]
MMQFTEAPNLHHHHQMIPLSSNPVMLNKLNNSARPWPAGFPSSTKPIATGLGDANCMEQLLVHCATAIETNDATLAQQILWVLNNIAPADGDSNQRLTCGFLRALVSRAARTGSCKILASAINTSTSLSVHKFSVIELASFVDLTPWHRFGFTAANAAILDAVEGYTSVHIVDLSLTHCMQIPTLIDALATRLESPPLLKLTVAGATEDVPPMLELSYEELGSKLMNFARSRNITMEFRVIPSSSSDGFASLIDQIRAQNLVHSNIGEALIVNCHMMLHYIPEETLSMGHHSDNVPNPSLSSCPDSFSFRNFFLKEIRTLDPTLVILVDEDADFTSRNLVTRLRSAFNYLWIPYDTVDTFLAKGSKQRQWYEADICWKIENVIAEEGVRRVERAEPKEKWVQRMRSSGFREVCFGEEVSSEVKSMLDEHAAAWGLKKEDDELVLTWKGHNVVFASAWVPSV